MKFAFIAAVLASSRSLVDVSGLEEQIVIPQSELQAMLPQTPSFNYTLSDAFTVGSDDEFITTAEASNFTDTATYEEVTDFFTRLSAQSEFVQVESLVELETGEDVWMVTVSGEQQFSADTMTRPVFFVTAGIHAGESLGVNAGMMFARNLVMDPEYADLLNSVNFLIIPVLNIQGYVRQSENGRINQFGPNTSGRRINGNWLNLNRDFGKIDTPEIRAVVSVMSRYDVSFYADLHSTDGMNSQEDVTWCDNGFAGVANEIDDWLSNEMKPDLEEFLVGYGFQPGPCYLANAPSDPTAGYYPYLSDGPTYSASYANIRQIPAYLLESHSLKPFKQRVLGGYGFLYGVMTVLSQKTDSLRAVIVADRAARVGTLLKEPVELLVH